MRKNNCRACTMLESGVKFRKSPKHTCGKFGSLHAIKIPKVNPDHLHDVLIFRTGMIESKNALLVRCQKQIIDGVSIPSGFEIWVPNANTASVSRSFSSRPIIHVIGWKLNEVLRTLYIDQLRNG